MDWWIYLIIWLVIFAALLIVELETENLTTVWFACSSFVSAILSVFKVDFVYQLIVFASLSVVLLIITRPLIKKYVKKEVIHTNSDKIIKQVGIVTVDILPNEVGEVRVKSENWRAICLEQIKIEKGEKVTIDSFSGNKVIVSKINDNEIFFNKEVTNE